MELLETLGDRKCRNFIAQADDDDAELEVIHEADRPVLTLWQDQGSCTWHGRSWLAYCQGLRVVVLADYHHRRHNNALQATRSSGMSAIRVTAILSLNFTQGPWGESANQNRMEQCMKAWLRANDASHPLFEIAYPSLAWDMYQGNLPADYGSKPDLSKVYAWASSSDVFTHRHETVKSGRWHNLASRIDRLAKTGALVVFAAVLLGT